MKKFHFYFIIFNALFIIVSFANLSKVVPFDIKSLLPKGHSVRVQYENYLKSFNDENQVAIQLVSIEKKFSEYEISSLSEQIVGFLKKESNVEKVVGPSNILYFKIKNDQLKTESFFEAGKLTDEGKKELQKPFWKNSFLTESSDSFIVSFNFKKSLKRQDVERVINDLNRFLLDLKNNHNFDYGLTGAKIVSNALLKEMILMHVVIAPLLIIIIASFLYYMFRSYKILFWCLYVIFLTLALTLQLIIFVENGLGPYSTFAIIFSAIVATSDLIQFWSRYSRLEGDADSRLEKAFKISRIPCLITSITTAIGFFALVLNQNLPIKYFGIYCTFSCVVEWVLIFYGLPVLFKYFKIDEPQFNFVPEKNDRFVQKLILNHSVKILIVNAVFFVATIYYTFQLKIDDNFYAKFVDTHPFSKSVQMLSSSFNYVGSIDIVFSPGKKEALSDEYLNFSNLVIQTNRHS